MIMNYRNMATVWLLVLLGLPLHGPAQEAPPQPATHHGDAMIASYFQKQTSQLEDA